MTAPQNNSPGDSGGSQFAIEAELGRVLEVSLNELFIFDAQSLKFVLANQGARTNLGYDWEELREMTPVDIKPDFDKAQFDGIIAPLITGTKDSLRFETIHQRKDGSRYEVEVNLQRGEFHGRDVLIAIILDITERKALEAALRESEEISRSILETAPHPILTIDEDSTIVSANPAAENTFGYGRAELIGQNVKILMPSPYREGHDGYVSNYLKTGENRIIGIGREVTARHKDGSAIPIDLAVGEVKHPSGKRLFTGIIRDISQRKALEDKLFSVSEDERRTIGREIHDDICQRLFGIGCLVKVLESRVGDVPDDVAQRIAELSKLVGGANTRAREMAHGLVPVPLVSDGLMGALSELATTTSRSTGICCRFHCETPVLIDDSNTSIQLYRIGQEAVKNAVHHGSPQAINISLSDLDNKITLEVRDDGIGLRSDGAEPEGMGLLTMKHRARSLGGSCMIQSNHGAIVKCIVPSKIDSSDGDGEPPANH